MSLMPFIYLRYMSPILVIKASLFFIMQTLSPNTCHLLWCFVLTKSMPIIIILQYKEASHSF